jgi:hypothetical protein
VMPETGKCIFNYLIPAVDRSWMALVLLINYLLRLLRQAHGRLSTQWSI